MIKRSNLNHNNQILPSRIQSETIIVKILNTWKPKLKRKRIESKVYTEFIIIQVNMIIGHNQVQNIPIVAIFDLQFFIFYSLHSNYIIFMFTAL